jgi:AcrR family transcriptional regulator
MPRRGLNADRVVEQAAALADTDGLEAVTLAAVAAALNVRPPSLYNHVPGRDGLRRAIALRALGELAAAMRDASVGRAGLDALAAAARAYRAYAHAHPGRYAATLAAPAEGDEKHAAAGRAVLDVVLGVIRGWELDPEAAVHAVRIVRSALHGFVALEAAGGFGLPVDLEASFERLVATVAGGLSAAPSAPARG